MRVLYPQAPIQATSESLLRKSCLEVLEAQEMLTTARTALVSAVVQYNKAQAGLLRATGELSVSALAATL